MKTATKISISLPTQALDRADRERRETGESRSEFFRRALESLFESTRREAAIRRYVEGYVAEPETEYDASTAVTLAASSFELEDWG